jgi:stearoyl-CoA desaturase (Delta-9 desaturase)
VMGMSVATDRLADPESADTDRSELAGSPAGGDGPTPEEIQVPVLENVDRAITGVITLVPPLLLVLAGWQLWNRELRWRDIAIFLIMYVPTGLGVTVGFHRLLTHRSFKTSPFLRGVLAVLGTMAVEGPVISWVSDHRKHHAYSDRFGDPHSPHVDHDGGWRGALRGLAHAHVGWLFDHTQRGSRERFAPDLLADPVVSFVDRTFLLWSLVGFAIPFGLGVLMGGTVDAGLEGMLWGGAVRMLVLHHVTYSINSLCHFFGRRRFATEDHSRNLLWLAPFSLGEAWHNNHHAFPTSAFHGMGRRELDISGLVIAALERAGLVWDVQRITPTRLAAKAL